MREFVHECTHVNASAGMESPKISELEGPA